MAHFGRNLKDQSWRIICGRTEADALKYKLFLQLSDDPCPFQNPPYISTKNSLPSAIISCNIIDSRNETKIRESAEFIRKRIDYPFAMFCAEYDRSTRKRKNSFLHTPHGELYRYNDEEFELAYSNQSEVTVERRVLESKASLWPGKLPSYVTDQDYIYLPSTEEGIAKMRDERAGKWMLYTSRSDMARHDGRFLAMVTLFQKGIFVGLKAATAMPNKGQEFQKFGNGFGSRDGVLILCYTANSEDKEDLLKAVQAVRGTIEYDYIIYYKTNSASIEGKFQHEGKRSVNKYMHTVGGGFYEKDEFNRFKLVV
ncbi:hypothetical protein JTE90_017307 [Oedothorax gibbosus]|uniref:Uncharacterized protein n=1 Tax=Oedothorax gibbosus TaxID=931172 RepID=A0AAV6UD36_9ARAC|nr:hypothetical protein JTE90_017307 [Oedothorax gibbosus]